MAYRYDIFISYVRSLETLRWLRMQLCPLLQHRVELALGRRLRVFIHEVTYNIPAGEIWPVHLAQELAASRILIPLWTRNFFNSLWCTCEMAHMFERQAQFGNGAPGLVIPLKIHGDNDLPQNLGIVQCLDISSCYNTRMKRYGRRAEKLSDLIDTQAPHIATTIAGAPAWNAAWTNLAIQTFVDAYYERDPPIQSTVPRFS